MKYILRKVKNFVKNMANAKQSGVALVITMMVTLTLILISLSIVMQSNTEQLISQNEHDSFRALSDGEYAIDFANRKIRTYIVQNKPTDLDAILNGSLSPAGLANMLGFKNNMDVGMNRLGIRNDTEETHSGLDILPGYTGTWEVFRLGVDENNDNLYDGNVRTVVYARLLDNWDTVGYLDTDDTDLRMRIEVRTIYPVLVENDGSEVDLGGGRRVTATRGQSERHLAARFGPVGSVAIRSDSNMRVEGTLEICGECGSAHANGTMTWEGPSACGSVTGTEGFNYTGGNILGDQGTQPEIYIPIVNPYNSMFMPSTTIFNTSADLTLPSFLRCAGPSADDPGNSKYFAIVKADNNTVYIYKAYRNFGDAGNATEPPPNTRWVWRLIGNSDIEGLDTIRLDNCGRVVDCGLGVGEAACARDAIRDPISGIWTPVAVSTGVTGQNNTFYGWNPDNSLSLQACPSGGEFETIPNTPYQATVDLSNSAQNDWVVNDFPHVNTVSTYNASAVKSVSNPRSTSCDDNGWASCVYTQPLPGVRAIASVAGLMQANDDGDNIGDFNTANIINNGDIGASGNDIYSPLYNAVIFTYANVDVGRNVSRLYYNDGLGNAAANIDVDDDAAFDLNATWRLTVIGWGNIRGGGTININPPAGDPNYRWALIAGRDLRLHGTANDLACHGTDCNGAPSGTQANFAGAYLAHESIGFNGTIGVNGFVVAEDRASCSQYEDSTVVNGSLDIHYDCNNPADIWKSESVRMKDWEEMQRVQ